MSGLCIFVATFLVFTGHCQPWYSRDGNHHKSAYVDEAALSESDLTTFRLRWQITNISDILAEAGVPNAQSFCSFSTPLIPNTQAAGDDTILIMVNQFLMECSDDFTRAGGGGAIGSSSSSSSSGFPPIPPNNDCIRTFVASLNGTTGALRWISPHNVSWLWPSPDANGTFPVWAAGRRQVYIANEPGIENYTLTAFDIGTGKIQWEVTLPYAGMYMGGFPFSIQESSKHDAVMVVLAQYVQAYSVSTGKLLWSVNLPNTTNPMGNYYVSSCSMLIDESDLLIVSYTAFQLTAATVAFDIVTGHIVWTNPYYMLANAQVSVSTGFSPPGTDGVNFVYFQAPLTTYTTGVGIVALNNGSLIGVYGLDVNHNFVGSNFVAFPNGDMTVVYGDSTDWANPSWIFNYAGLNSSFYINGTSWSNADNCASFFGVRKEVVYAFCGGDVVAFTMPPAGEAGRKEASIIWSVSVNEPIPDNLQLSADGQRYLGNGRFLRVANNNNDYENQWLKSMQMFF